MGYDLDVCVNESGVITPPNGFKIRAIRCACVSGEGSTYIVLAARGPKDFATWRYDHDAGDFALGHYFDNPFKAYTHFMER